MPGAQEGQKQVSDPLDLELQSVLSCYVGAKVQIWVPTPTPQKQPVLLTAESALQPVPIFLSVSTQLKVQSLSRNLTPQPRGPLDSHFPASSLQHLELQRGEVLLSGDLSSGHNAKPKVPN